MALLFSALQYILVANLLYTDYLVSLNHIPLVSPSPLPSHVGNVYFVSYICEPVFVLLYAFLCFIFRVHL